MASQCLPARQHYGASEQETVGESPGESAEESAGESPAGSGRQQFSVESGAAGAAGWLELTSESAQRRRNSEEGEGEPDRSAGTAEDSAGVRSAAAGTDTTHCHWLYDRQCLIES